MDDNVARIIKMSIDLIVASVVIAAIALFAYYSHKVASIKMQQDSTKKMMKAKVELYEYDNKMVSGSDIVDIVQTNIRLYKFEIKTSIGTYTISADKEYDTDSYGIPYGIKLWSEKHLRENVLGDNIFSKYKATLLKNSSQDTIIGVKFVQEGV